VLAASLQNFVAYYAPGSGDSLAAVFGTSRLALLFAALWALNFAVLLFELTNRL